MKTITSLLIAGAFFISSHTHADDGTSLNKDEVRSHLLNMTEEWTKGAGYYGPNGVLSVKWTGEEHQGRWRIRDDGWVCIYLDIWGAEDCSHYVNENGKIKLVWNGDTTLRKMLPGNQIDKF